MLPYLFRVTGGKMRGNGIWFIAFFVGVCLLSVWCYLRGLPRSRLKSLTGEQPAPNGKGKAYFKESATGASSPLSISLNCPVDKYVCLTMITINGTGSESGNTVVMDIVSGSTLIVFIAVPIPQGPLQEMPEWYAYFLQPIRSINPGEPLTITLPSFGSGNTRARLDVSGYTE